MKTYLTIVRHAQTVANQKRLFAGKMEVDVSEEGYRQIAFLEKRLSQEKFDVVYSSPNIRAVQTVAGIAQKQGLPLIIDENLQEMGYGEMEGLPREELPLRYPEAYAFFEKYDYFSLLPGQEELEDALKRYEACLRQIANDNLGKHVLIATHGQILRGFLCQLTNTPFPESEQMKNTAVNELEYDSETQQFHIISQNDTSHYSI